MSAAAVAMAGNSDMETLQCNCCKEGTMHDTSESGKSISKSLEFMFVQYTRSDMKSAIGVHASSELGKPVL